MKVQRLRDEDELEELMERRRMRLRGISRLNVTSSRIPRFKPSPQAGGGKFLGFECVSLGNRVQCVEELRRVENIYSSPDAS